MAKKQSLVEILRSKPCTRTGPKTWFDKLAPEAKEELEAVRQEFHDNPGKYSKTHVFETMADPKVLGLTIKRASFIRWLEEKPNG